MPDHRQQVVLAKADEPDVFDQHHLVVFLREQLFEMAAGILMQALEDLGIHPGDAVGRLAQPLAVGVFAHGQQDLSDRPANRSRSIVAVRRTGADASSASPQPAGTVSPPLLSGVCSSGEFAGIG